MTTVSTDSVSEKLAEYHRQIAELRQKVRQAQASIPPREVEDYRFASAQGTVRLSELFGDKDTLFVIHSMGASCPYCTLWADGFNGILAHIESRAAFVISSPDAPATQDEFKASRGWRMRMVSHQGSRFAADMGFKPEGRWLPGISVFRKKADKLFRVVDTPAGPGDGFCVVWNLLDLIPEGPAGWKPQISYY
jgi:predicted dithiol-disulfide oxidoreductase (DUF899 family)